MSECTCYGAFKCEPCVAETRIKKLEDVATELLRLYDLRFKLAAAEKDQMEKTGRYNAELKRKLSQYGHAKKQAWEDLRKLLQ